MVRAYKFTWYETKDTKYGGEPNIRTTKIGLSNPIESGCHGKSKRGKKKAVKSAAQISEIHNATSDCFVRITRSDVPEVGQVNDTITL